MCPRVGIVRPLLHFFQDLAQTEVWVAVKEWVFRHSWGPCLVELSQTDGGVGL